MKWYFDCQWTGIYLLSGLLVNGTFLDMFSIHDAIVVHLYGHKGPTVGIKLVKRLANQWRPVLIS